MSNGQGGPYLTTAILCEKVIQSAEGVLSAINIIDQVTQEASGTEVPSQMPPFQLQLSGVIGLKAGSARGRFAVKLRPEDPSGSQQPAMEFPVQFSGPEGSGVNLLLNVGFQVELEGLYWFDVILVEGPDAERRLTRIPLNVLYHPTRTGPAPPSPTA